MTLLQSLLLGLLQGVTEFLPVSSSGHLALAELFFGLSIPPRDLQAFDIVLHAGSLIALLLLYRSVWWSLLVSPFRGDTRSLRLLFLLVLATIPAVIAGFLFERVLAEQFRSLFSLAIQLIVTGVVLFVAESFRGEQRMSMLRPGSATVIGVAQALALVPAISRSGMTIAAGRMVGLSKRDSIDFSFLLAAPALAGAVVFTLSESIAGNVNLPPLSVTVTGFFASLLASIVAVALLRGLAAVLRLRWFAFYLFALAAVLLWYHFDLGHLWDPTQVQVIVQSYGTIPIFLFSLMEAVPPLSFLSPGILALVVAGSLVWDVGTGVHFILASLAGLTLGNMILYLLGESYGRRIAHRLSLTNETLARIDRFTARFGVASVFLGQFVGAVRPFISFLVGTSHMPRRRFYSAMLLGSSCFAVSFIGLGIVARQNIEWVLSIVGSSGILILLFSAITVWCTRRVRERRKHKSTSRRYHS